jgi:versiconal hemiacetal acetate esterase
MPGEYAESWKKWEEVAGRAILHGTPSELKAMGAAMTSAFAHLQPPPPETVDVHENEVDGIKYRVYTPQSESGPLPIAIWYARLSCFYRNKT